MESQISAIVCPNCGANTTNRVHCDYCGSVLVRFVDHGISIDSNKYGRSAKAIDGLEEALSGNLLMQETCGENEYVITNMTADLEVLRVQFIQSDAASIGTTGVNPLKNATKGNIALRVPFAVRSDDYATMMNAKDELNTFKQLDCFSLFTPQQYEGGIAYYIDFGTDTLTAAQVFTQITKEINRDDQLFDFQTIIKNKGDIDFDATGALAQKEGYGKQIAMFIIAMIVILLFYMMIL